MEEHTGQGTTFSASANVLRLAGKVYARGGKKDQTLYHIYAVMVTKDCANSNCILIQSHCHTCR